MSRVNENREATRLTEQRAAKAMREASNHKARESFSKALTQSDQKQAKTAQNQRNLASQKAETTQKGQSALLARQGIVNNRFSKVLHQKGGHNLGVQHAETKERRTSMLEERVTGDRTSGDQAQEAKTVDHARVTALKGDEGRDGGNSRGGGQEQPGQNPTGKDPMSNSLGTISDAALAPAQVTEAQASRAPAGLPPALIQQIVQRVMVGVSAKGLQQLHIEFKHDVLGGLRLSVETKDGKVSAKFVTTDPNVRRLLKASEGELARAFGKKGMQLEDLTVSDT